MPRGVFGQQLDVKLDLFHAVKRFPSSLKKLNPSRGAMIREFKTVFRQDDDMGINHNQPTPSPDVITAHIDNYISRWKDVQVGGIRALNANSLKSLKNIQVHGERGCLSAIPRHAGTNKNERLHRTINSHGVLGKSTKTIGVKTANAALARCFHPYNNNIQCVSSLTLKTCYSGGSCRGLCQSEGMYG